MAIGTSDGKVYEDELEKIVDEHFPVGPTKITVYKNQPPEGPSPTQVQFDPQLDADDTIPANARPVQGGWPSHEAVLDLMDLPRGPGSEELKTHNKFIDPIELTRPQLDPKNIHKTFLSSDDKFPEKKADLEKFVRERLTPIMPEGSGKMELDKVTLAAIKFIEDGKNESFIPKPTGDWKMDALNLLGFSMLGLTPGGPFTGGPRIPRHQGPAAMTRQHLPIEFQKETTAADFNRERFFDIASAARRDELIGGVKPQGEIPPLDVPPRGTPEYAQFEADRAYVNRTRQPNAHISDTRWENLSQAAREEAVHRADVSNMRANQSAAEQSRPQEPGINPQSADALIAELEALLGRPNIAGSIREGTSRPIGETFEQQNARIREALLNPRSGEGLTQGFQYPTPGPRPAVEIPDFITWMRNELAAGRGQGSYETFLSQNRQALQGEMEHLNQIREAGGFRPMRIEQYAHLSAGYRQELLNSPVGVAGFARPAGENTLPSSSARISSRTGRDTPITLEKKGTILDHRTGVKHSDGTEQHRFEFDTPRGRAGLSLSKTPMGDVYVEWIGLRRPMGNPRANENVIGPREVIKMRKELEAYFPDMKTISGFRIGGAQTGNSRTKRMVIKRRGDNGGPPLED